MEYYLGEVWVFYSGSFWRKSYSKKIRTVLIKAEDKQTATNKIQFYAAITVRKEFHLAETNPVKIKGFLIETLQ
jgi:hypothetical protein